MHIYESKGQLRVLKTVSDGHFQTFSILLTCNSHEVDALSFFLITHLIRDQPPGRFTALVVQIAQMSVCHFKGLQRKQALFSRKRVYILT